MWSTWEKQASIYPMETWISRRQHPYYIFGWHALDIPIQAHPQPNIPVINTLPKSPLLYPALCETISLANFNKLQDV